MNAIKKTAEYRIFQKRSGRYAVRNARKQWVNGDDKLAILRAEGLLAEPRPKKAPVEDAAAEAEAAA